MTEDELYEARVACLRAINQQTISAHRTHGHVMVKKRDHQQGSPNVMQTATAALHKVKKQNINDTLLSRRKNIN